MKQVQPSSTDWAYLAGLIDGEGCISSRNSKKTNRYQARIAISQRDHGFLEKVQSRFGVGWFTHSGDQLVWGVTKRTDVRWLLEGVMPFLSLKRPQAVIGLLLLDKPEGKVQVALRNQLKALKQHAQT